MNSSVDDLHSRAQSKKLQSPKAPSLPLAPQTDVLRKLSTPEYYHAAVGRSANTLEQARISIMMVEGISRITPLRWETALRRVAAANPGTRMRLLGQRQRARWSTEGACYPRLRFVDNCSWDGRSQHGAEFIDATPLDLETGPVVELIIANGATTLVILRAHHAVMDGMGMLHFFRELFRALRDEPLQGCNAAFSDVELMREVTQSAQRTEKESSENQSSDKQSGDKLKKNSPIPLTGGAQGTEFGDVWQRLTLPLTPQQNVMGRIAELAARYARNFGSGTVRFAVPVSLRRHLPGLLSTLNFTGLLHIDLEPNGNAEDFRRKLRTALDEKRDAAYHPILNWVRYLPFSWVDWISGRRPSNYLQRKLVETVLITNFGVVDLRELACTDFDPSNFFSLPIAGNSFISLYASGDHLNIIVGMPTVYAVGGRMDRFVEQLQQMLG